MASKSEPAVQRLTMVVDLDERGSFRAHVEDGNGKCIFEFSNEDESGWPSDEGLWLVEGGYMKHSRDIDGVLAYMQQAGIAKSNATIQLVG